MSDVSLEELFETAGGELIVNGMNTTIRTDPEAWSTFEREVLNTICAIWQKPTDLDVTEWAEEVVDPAKGHTNFMLADEAGQVMPGPYSSSNGSPIMKYIQNWFSDPEVRVMSWCLAAQVGKTLGLNIIHAYVICTRPGNQMIVYPKTDVAKNKAKDDFWPNFRASPEVAKRILGGIRHKYRKSTLLNMQYPGGSFKFASAESPSETVSIPVDVATLDERDRQNDGEAGDLFLGIMQRQGRVANGKLIEASTPLGGAQESKILRSCNMPGADRTTPHVVCLSRTCQHEFHPEWEMVDVPKDDAGEMVADGAVLICPSCGKRHSDAELITMMARFTEANLKQMGTFGCCGAVHDPAKVRLWTDRGLAQCPTCHKPRGKKHRSIIASFLFSGTTLKDKVYQYIRAVGSGDISAKKRFWNEALARPFEHAANLDPTLSYELSERRECLSSIYGHGVMVPLWAKNLTMSVDVQRKNGGRLEWQIMAHGDDDESMVIRYGRIPGAATDVATWWGEPDMDENGKQRRDEDGRLKWIREGLEQVRTRFYPGVEGRLYPVTLSGVDIGDQADAITKNYTDQLSGKGVVPLRGRPGDIEFCDFEMSWSEKHKHAHYPVGVWAGRDILSHRLRIKVPKDHHVRVPGALRFAADLIDASTGELIVDTGIPTDFFEQLTNFRMTLKKVNGQLVERWTEESKSVPEEALDNTLYNWYLQKLVQRINHVTATNDLPDKWIPGDKVASIARRLSKETNKSPFTPDVARLASLPGTEVDEDGSIRNIPPKEIPEVLGMPPRERPRVQSTSSPWSAGIGMGMYGNDPRARGGRM